MGVFGVPSATGDPLIPWSGSILHQNNLQLNLTCPSLLFCKFTFSHTRFRIHLRVEDESGETIFTMFNQQAEQLLDISANKIINRLGIENPEFPPEISALAGRSFDFKIKMPDYSNDDTDLHNLRVVRISEVTPIPQPSCSRLSHKKVCVLLIIYTIGVTFAHVCFSFFYTRSS